MRREPTMIGLPHCWGRFRDDAECGACRYCKSCDRTTDQWSSRTTLAEAAVKVLDEVMRPGTRDVDVETIVLFAYSRYRRAGGKEFPPWRNDQRFMRAMSIVRDACMTAGIDPLVYVTAQVEWMKLVIQKGVPLQPGHFHGDNADERFRKWSRFHARHFGNATTLEADRKARGVTMAAAATYAAFRIHGHGHDAALERARELLATFKPEKLTPAQRTVALFEALLGIDPAIPRKLFMPEGGWTWDDAEQAIKSLDL